MQAYQKANEIGQSKAAWIVANIGNLLNNRGLHSEAKKHLNEALLLDSNSEYVLNRLASAIKFENEEAQKYNSRLKEGINALSDISNLLS